MRLCLTQFIETKGFIGLATADEIDLTVEYPVKLAPLVACSRACSAGMRRIFKLGVTAELPFFDIPPLFTGQVTGMCF